MSRKILSGVLIPLTTLAVLMGGWFFSPASATTPSPSEEPSAVDACGDPSTPGYVNFDLFMIPTPSNYYYGVNGVNVSAGPHVTPTGAPSVTVQMMDKNTGEILPDRVLTYPNTGPCGPEAPNTYDVAIGACNAAYGRTDVDGVPYNTADATHKYLPEARVSAKPVVGYSTGQYPTYMVLDGKDAHVPVATDLHGLQPGTFDFLFFTNGNWTTPAAVVRKIVPECGIATFPPGDPAGGGGSGSTQGAKPKGLVHLADCRTGVVKGSTSTKDVLPKGGKTTFLYKVPGVKKPIKVKMLNGVKKPKVKVFRHVPYRKLVRLYYKKGHKLVLLSKDGNYGCGGSRR